MKYVKVPIEPPSSIPDTSKHGYEFDETLFELCRNDDYHGLYREFIKRAKVEDGA
jgi:hypothetical protein